MSNIYTKAKELLFRIFTSWHESLAFLRSRKSLEAFLLVSIKAFYSLMSSLVAFILIFTYLVFTLISLEPIKNYSASASDLPKLILLIAACSMASAALAGLRPSIAAKGSAYYANCLLRLVPLIFAIYILCLLVFPYNAFSLYALLYAILASPMLCFCILFLLDSKPSYTELYTSLKQAFVFCMLNAPALAILYGLLGLAMVFMHSITAHLTQPVFAYLSYIVLIVGIFFPYWSMLSSLYIKRMHDQIEYYL